MGESRDNREQDRKSVRIAVVTVAVVFAVAISLGVVAVVASSDGGSHNGENNGHGETEHSSEMVQVPDVVGMSVHQAQEALEACGLEMSLSGEEEEGEISGQHPEAGHQAEKHSEVTVEVGGEHPPHEAPHTEEEAEPPHRDHTEEEAGHH